MKVFKNLIIGAGPAGLATAGRMREANLDFVMLEKSQHVGNAWRNHYDRLHLHTVKQWSHLPHMPFSDDYPTYVSRQQLVDYMEKYAAHFSLQPHFGVEVVSIKKRDKNWEVTALNKETYVAEHVILATGLNSAPKVPNWSGQEIFRGNISHSKFYKNPRPFAGQKILVIGIGNTGAEIALDLSNAGCEVFIVARHAITVVPRDLNGRPVQVTAKLLEKLPLGLGDWLGSQIRKIYYGDLSKYGLKVAKEHPAQLLRETGKTPLIDIGTIDAIKQGKIKVVGDIDHFTEQGVQFKNDGHEDFDSVILATGYRAHIEKIVERGEALLDPYGCPKSPVGSGFHEGLFFVGFDNYKLGGILGTIFNDSKTVVDYLLTN